MTQRLRGNPALRERRTNHDCTSHSNTKPEICACAGERCAIAIGEKILLWLKPIVDETVSHDPGRAERLRALHHYGDQLVVTNLDRYRLAPEVYTIAYVPFRPEFFDTLVVAAVAIFISFLATLYPSAAASRLHPVEALRYE